jgi:hypothetical protein
VQPGQTRITLDRQICLILCRYITIPKGKLASGAPLKGSPTGYKGRETGQDGAAGKKNIAWAIDINTCGALPL